MDRNCVSLTSGVKLDYRLCGAVAAERVYPDANASFMLGSNYVVLNSIVDLNCKEIRILMPVHPST